MKKAYLVTKSTSEDYYGTYLEVIAIYATEESAREKVAELYDEDHPYNIEYDYETYNLEP